MTNLLDINKNIKFNKTNHSYTNDKNKKLVSVSQLIKFYQNKFDEYGHIARACSKRDGVSVEEILKKWKNTKNEGLNRGTNFHRQIEHYIKTGEILDDSDKDIIEQFSKIKFSGKLFSEIQISSKKYLLAGTVDLIELLDDKNYNLFDLKTNKTLQKINKYGNKMLYPLQHLDDTSWQHYILQLNLYRHILSEHGYVCKSMKIFYINPENRQIEEHIIPFVDKDIKKVLKLFFYMLSFQNHE